jgi:hypothetical protein
MEITMKSLPHPATFVDPTSRTMLGRMPSKWPALEYLDVGGSSGGIHAFEPWKMAINARKYTL